MIGTLWIEMIIAGSVYVIAVVFWLSAAYGISDISAILPSKELLPYVSACLVAVAYVTGIIFHRLTQALAPYVLLILARLLNFVKNRKQNNLPQRRIDMAEIWQLGSARIHREIDFQYALVALLRSLIFSIPFMGSGVVAWMLKTHKNGLFFLIAIDLVFWIFVCFSYQRQWLQFQAVQQAVLEVVRRTSTHNLSKDHVA